MFRNLIFRMLWIKAKCPSPADFSRGPLLLTDCSISASSYGGSLDRRSGLVKERAMRTASISTLPSTSWVRSCRFFRRGRFALAFSPSLFRVIAVELFLELAAVALVVLLFIISVWVMCILYCCRPELFRPPNRGANKEDIEKLKEIVFEKPESMGIQEEDAQCAICLSQYEAADKIRYLPCKHHFHSACIDEWLIKNKTCPFCKRAIDDKQAAPEPTQSTVENEV